MQFTSGAAGAAVLPLRPHQHHLSLARRSRRAENITKGNSSSNSQRRQQQQRVLDAEDIPKSQQPAQLRVMPVVPAAQPPSTLLLQPLHSSTACHQPPYHPADEISSSHHHHSHHHQQQHLSQQQHHHHHNHHQQQLPQQQQQQHIQQSQHAYHRASAVPASSATTATQCGVSAQLVKAARARTTTSKAPEISQPQRALAQTTPQPTRKRALHRGSPDAVTPISFSPADCIRHPPAGSRNCRRSRSQDGNGRPAPGVHRGEQTHQQPQQHPQRTNLSAHVVEPRNRRHASGRSSSTSCGLEHCMDCSGGPRSKCRGWICDSPRDGPLEAPSTRLPKYLDQEQQQPTKFSQAFFSSSPRNAAAAPSFPLSSRRQNNTPAAKRAAPRKRSATRRWEAHPSFENETSGAGNDCRVMWTSAVNKQPSPATPSSKGPETGSPDTNKSRSSSSSSRSNGGGSGGASEQPPHPGFSVIHMNNRSSGISPESSEGVMSNSGSTSAVAAASSEDRFMFHLAVVTLYRDQIRPQESEIKHRLVELHCSPFLERHFLSLASTLQDQYIVQRMEGTAAVFLVRTPAWFQGWVDVRDTRDPYPPHLWVALRAWLTEKLRASGGGLGDSDGCREEGRGGRYGLSKKIKLRGPPEFRRYSLGQVCHIVQLAVHQGMLAYDGGALMPAVCCSCVVRRLFPPSSDSFALETSASPENAMIAAGSGSGCSGNQLDAQSGGAGILSCINSVSNTMGNGNNIGVLVGRRPGGEAVDESTCAAASDLQEVLAGLRTLFDPVEGEQPPRPMLLSQLKLRYLHRLHQRLDPTFFGFTRLSDFIAEKCGSVCRLVREGGRQVLVDRVLPPSEEATTTTPTATTGTTTMAAATERLAQEDPAATAVAAAVGEGNAGRMQQTDEGTEATNPSPLESQIGMSASKFVTRPRDQPVQRKVRQTLANNNPQQLQPHNPNERTAGSLLSIVARHTRFHTSLSFAFWQFLGDSDDRAGRAKGRMLPTDSLSVEEICFGPAGQFMDSLFSEVLRPSATTVPQPSANEEFQIRWFSRQPLIERQLSAAGYGPLQQKDTDCLAETYHSVLPARGVSNASEEGRITRPSKLRRLISAKIAKLRAEYFSTSSSQQQSGNRLERRRSERGCRSTSSSGLETHSVPSGAGNFSFPNQVTRASLPLEANDEQDITSHLFLPLINLVDGDSSNNDPSTLAMDTTPRREGEFHAQQQHES